MKRARLDRQLNNCKMVDLQTLYQTSNPTGSPPNVSLLYGIGHICWLFNVDSRHKIIIPCPRTRMDTYHKRGPPPNNSPERIAYRYIENNRTGSITPHCPLLVHDIRVGRDSSGKNINMSWLRRFDISFL